MFTLTERQFVNCAEHKYMVAVKIVWPIGVFGIHRVVRAVEIVSVGVGVVPQDLQALGESLLNLDLERIVVATGIISKVVANITGAANQWFPAGIQEIRIGERGYA